jgi:hypothetical protein
VQFTYNAIRIGCFKNATFALESNNNNISPCKNTLAHLFVVFKTETAFPVRYELRQKKELRSEYDTRTWSIVSILLKSGENLLCGLGLMGKFTISTFFVMVFCQNFKSRIITDQICQNFYTLIKEESVAFLDIRAHHWEVFFRYFEGTHFPYLQGFWVSRRSLSDF